MSTATSSQNFIESFYTKGRHLLKFKFERKVKFFPEYIIMSTGDPNRQTSFIQKLGGPWGTPAVGFSGGHLG